MGKPINNKMLKGTDWFITPTRHYIKTISGNKFTINKRCSYTSRKGNKYKRYYSVYFDKTGTHLGKRRRFKDAMALAEKTAKKILNKDV